MMLNILMQLICLNTLEVFETIKEAMEKYKTTNLYGHLRRPNRYKSAGKDKDGNKLKVNVEDYLVDE